MQIVAIKETIRLYESLEMANKLHNSVNNDLKISTSTHKDLSSSNSPNKITITIPNTIDNLKEAHNKICQILNNYNWKIIIR